MRGGAGNGNGVAGVGGGSKSSSTSPYGKPGCLRDPRVAALFSTKDPETRYDDLREIGHGSFGAVFFAFDKEKSETVAIKKMAFSGKAAVEKWNDIIKEVSFLTKVKHPHIIEYKACFLKEHTCWLVMEYCIGSAADIVDVHRKGLLEPEIAAICAQTLEALSYLHSMGRIHRDVKAGNILLTDNAIVKLADYGSASLVSPAQTFIGTPFFMAPEVILAMDEGHYTHKADIWSLGIACIELAERRPPLFNMNAMSALYHIAQNEPPTLAPLDDPSATPWSPRFRAFVDGCLRKDPDARMTTEDCRNHVFITDRRETGNVIAELIARTKDVVRELDNSQYRKMRKLVYLDEQSEGGLDAKDDGADGASQGQPDSIGGPDSSENSLASFRSQSTGNGGGNTPGGTPGPSPSRRTRPPIPPQMRNGGADDDVSITDENVNRTMIRVGDDGETGKGEERLRAGGSPDSSSRTTPPLILPPQRDVKVEMATLRKSKFSTLRTTKLISKELEEHNRDNNMYEQMSGYKRLRQAHHKELLQLEERCKGEMDALKARLDREIEQTRATQAKEMQKLKTAQAAEIEKRKRESEEAEKKLRKQSTAQQQHEMKAYQGIQLKEYKHNKERAKTDLKERGLSRGAFESSMKATKQRLQQQKEDAESQFQRDQRLKAEMELRRLKRANILALHVLEERLDSDEQNTLARQLDVRQAQLRRHLENMRDLEVAHMKEMHETRRRQMAEQLEAETTNQKDYTRRQTDELRKKHALQCKQQPRELKLREAEIRKQFRQAVKVQTKQYKFLQTQILQSMPREEHAELTRKLKEEQKRKMAEMAARYETSIEDFVNERTGSLESWQVEEAKSLAEKLSKEQDALTTFQTRQREALEKQLKEETERLAEKVRTRFEQLELRQNSELQEADATKEKAAEALRERQHRQLTQFDSENPMLRDSPSTSSVTTL